MAPLFINFLGKRRFILNGHGMSRLFFIQNLTYQEYLIRLTYEAFPKSFMTSLFFKGGVLSPITWRRPSFMHPDKILKFLRQSPMVFGLVCIYLLNSYGAGGSSFKKQWGWVAHFLIYCSPDKGAVHIGLPFSYC